MSEGQLGRVRERVAGLASFYGPFGACRVTDRYVAAASAFVAAIDFAGRTHDLSRPLSFGAALPAELDSTSGLLAADSQGLRTLLGPQSAIAAGERVVRLVTACGPPTMLYRSSGPHVEAWSTHAVAAAYLALGSARLDEGTLAEFLAARFVGGHRTLIRGAEAVDTASSTTLSESGVSSESYWPAAERWRLVDEPDAQAKAREALLSTLGDRLPGDAPLRLGLTGGLDSRVVAVALTELGRPFETLTFGGDAWDDLRAARAVAAELGVAHAHAPITWTGDAEALGSARRAARWHEGAIQLGIGRIAWPADMSGWVTGGGGETGRAFYYRTRSPSREAAGRDALDVLAANLTAQIRGADRSALDAVVRSAERWVADARGLGVEGWRSLDVVYAEQRVRRWLRGMLALESGVAVPAFGTPEVQRALASLPLSERLSDGFHRVYLERHAPALAPESRPASNPLRRRIGRGLRRLRRRREPASYFEGRWDEHPGFRAWVADEVMQSPSLKGQLGAEWCTETRRGFLAGTSHETANALWAAGPVALARELEALPQGQPEAPPEIART